MSYSTYKVIHFFGLFLLFFSFGGVWAVNYLKESKQKAYSKKIMMLHGIGSLFALLGGFGLLAKLKIHGSIPSWVFVKIFVLIFLVLSIPIFKRMKQVPNFALLICFALSVLAIYVAQVKTFL